MNHQTAKSRIFKFLFIPVLMLFSTNSHGQVSSVKYEIEAQAIATSNGVVPFWMRSNRFGSIPLPGISSSFIGKAYREYENSAKNENSPVADWGFGIEARANGGTKYNFNFIEAFAKAKLGIFQIKAGRSKDQMGLNGDSSLSSGNFAVSGNALGIPKIELSIPKYWRLPVLGGLFSVKGNFVHGWVGNARILDSLDLSTKKTKEIYYIKNKNPETYFHQKSFYVRLAKPGWKLKLYGGFNHQVFWGNEKSAYGSNFRLSPVKTFYYVATGKAYGDLGIPRSKIGNQIGSIDVGIEYDFDKLNILLYRQNFYDVGALSKLANIKDGLNGISFTNKTYKKGKSGFQFKKILFELFYSKDQAGYPWSTPTASGDEDYYNNYFYTAGWSYNGIVLGSPLITENHNAKKGQASREADYFINNRVIAIHTGISSSINSWQIISKLSYSWNYGTFGTSIYGNSTGNVRYPQSKDLFSEVKQLSFYTEAEKEILQSYKVGFSIGIDQGNLLNNSVGLMLKLNKSF
jgi:hypothetical protein